MLTSVFSSIKTNARFIRYLYKFKVISFDLCYQFRLVFGLISCVLKLLNASCSLAFGRIFFGWRKNSLDIPTHAYFSQRASLVCTFCLHHFDRVSAIEKGTVSLKFQLTKCMLKHNFSKCPRSELGKQNLQAKDFYFGMLRFYSLLSLLLLKGVCRVLQTRWYCKRRSHSWGKVPSPDLGHGITETKTHTSHSP